MTLITKDNAIELIANGLTALRHASFDPKPVVKLFLPGHSATYLITEMDCEDRDILFGLCDPGLGFPELGSVRLSEIESIRIGVGLKFERDRHFEALYPISVYARAAGIHRSITFDAALLEQASHAKK